MKIFFAIMAAILLFCMIGVDRQESRTSFTFGFVVTVLSITILYLIDCVMFL